jgi:hypothetical protein
MTRVSIGVHPPEGTNQIAPAGGLTLLSSPDRFNTVAAPAVRQPNLAICSHREKRKKRPAPAPRPKKKHVMRAVTIHDMGRLARRVDPAFPQ